MRFSKITPRQTGPALRSLPDLRSFSQVDGEGGLVQLRHGTRQASFRAFTCYKTGGLDFGLLKYIRYISIVVLCGYFMVKRWHSVRTQMLFLKFFPRFLCNSQEKSLNWFLHFGSLLIFFLHTVVVFQFLLLFCLRLMTTTFP